MIIKSTPEELCRRIQLETDSFIRSEIHQNQGRIDIGYTISMAIANAFKVMMEDLYTDEDFERDMTLDQPVV